MAQIEDFYDLLGVSKNATEDELKKAYRNRAREFHPDANNGDAEAEERFKLVTVAYETLRDPERRRRYDMFGPDGLRGTGGGAGAGGFEDIFGGVNLGDIFQSFFGGASPFGGGGGSRGPAGPPRGNDIEVAVTLDFREAVFGASHEVTLRVPVGCQTCSGTGARPGTTPVRCAQCGGAGEVRRVRQSIIGQMVSASPCPRCNGIGRGDHVAVPRLPGRGPSHRRAHVHGGGAGRRRRHPHPEDRRARCGRAPGRPVRATCTSTSGCGPTSASPATATTWSTSCTCP